MRLQSILVLLINSHDLFRHFSHRVRVPSEGRDDLPIVHCLGEARFHCRLTGESSRISTLDPSLTFTESVWDVWPGPAATTAASIRSNVPPGQPQQQPQLASASPFVWLNRPSAQSQHTSTFSQWEILGSAGRSIWQPSISYFAPIRHVVLFGRYAIHGGLIWNYSCDDFTPALNRSCPTLGGI